MQNLKDSRDLLRIANRIPLGFFSYRESLLDRVVDYSDLNTSGYLLEPKVFRGATNVVSSPHLTGILLTPFSEPLS